MKVRLAHMVRASVPPLCASCGLVKPESPKEKWYTSHVDQDAALKCFVCSYCRQRSKTLLKPRRELAVKSVRARVIKHRGLVNQHLMKQKQSSYMRRAITTAITQMSADMAHHHKRVKWMPAEWTHEFAGQLLRDRDVCAEFSELKVAMPAFRVAIKLILK